MTTDPRSMDERLRCGWKFNGNGPCVLPKGHTGVHSLKERPCGCAGLQMCPQCAESEGAKDAREALSAALATPSIPAPVAESELREILAKECVNHRGLVPFAKMLRDQNYATGEPTDNITLRLPTIIECALAAMSRLATVPSMQTAKCLCGHDYDSHNAPRTAWCVSCDCKAYRPATQHEKDEA